MTHHSHNSNEHAVVNNELG